MYKVLSWIARVFQQRSSKAVPAMAESVLPSAKRSRLDEEGSPAEAQATAGGPEKPKTNVSSVPRKHVILLSFSGSGYFGMQWNPDTRFRTIEGELIQALQKAKAIPDYYGGDLGKMHFQRCSRTDKNVSAARQLVTLKMFSLDSLVEKLNEHLPSQIRVMGVKRVTRGFSFKKTCWHRTYEYLLPSYAFAPFHLTNLDYRISDEVLSKVKEVFQLYVGTHNFHNFTSQKAFKDPSAIRQMKHFEVKQCFVSRGTCDSCSAGREVEFLLLQVKGQSFMLHQIRKMIGLVIAVVKGYCPVESVARAFQEPKMDIPKAPGLGLYLENVHMDGYNRRYGGDGIHEPLEWSAMEEQVASFKRDTIHKNIIDTELKEFPMMEWLATLKVHDFLSTVGARKEVESGASEQAEPTGTREGSPLSHGHTPLPPSLPRCQ